MEESEKGLRVRKFFEIEAKTLIESYQVIETLLPNSRSRGASHHGEEGRYIESLLRSFLNKHLPKSLRAISGFILCPSTKTGVQNLDRVTGYQDRHSKQLDIIVYDFESYPTYEQYEEFCIVPPEGVVGIISVKKRLYNKDLDPEISSIRDAAILCQSDKKRGPFTGIFAFSSQDSKKEKLNERAFNSIRNQHSNDPFGLMINEISVMGKTCIFKKRQEHGASGCADYIAVDCVQEKHIPLQRLIQSILSVHYDKTRGSTKERPGFVSFRRNTFFSAPTLGSVPYSIPPDSKDAS